MISWQTHGIFSIARRPSRLCFACMQNNAKQSIRLYQKSPIKRSADEAMSRIDCCHPGSTRVRAHARGWGARKHECTHDVCSSSRTSKMRLHIPARILCIFLGRGPYSRHSCFRMGIRRWEGSSQRPPDVTTLHRSIFVFNPLQIPIRTNSASLRRALSAFAVI